MTVFSLIIYTMKIEINRVQETLYARYPCCIPDAVAKEFGGQSVNIAVRMQDTISILAMVHPDQNHIATSHPIVDNFVQTELLV